MGETIVASLEDGDGFVSALRKCLRPPRPHAPKVENVPDGVEKQTSGCCGIQQRDGKWTKVPYQPRDPRLRAKADVPSTWATFGEACRSIQSDGEFENGIWV